MSNPQTLLISLNTAHNEKQLFLLKLFKAIFYIGLRILKLIFNRSISRDILNYIQVKLN